MHQTFDGERLQSQLAASGKAYLEFLRAPALSAGVYVLAAGGEDQQQPHRQDEIYYVLRGRARMRVAGQEFAVKPGQVIFIPARVPHRFFEISEELAALVVFAPAESG